MASQRARRQDVDQAVGKPMTRSVTWATLSRPARAYRVFHASWSVAGLASLGYIWVCVATRRRDRKLAASVAFLSMEGVGLIIGGGDCPMGPFQAELGDPVPFFELVLPPRAAKAAVPILAGASIAGILAVVLRPPTAAIHGSEAGVRHLRSQPAENSQPSQIEH
jgi:hypothetical protein